MSKKRRTAILDSDLQTLISPATVASVTSVLDAITSSERVKKVAAQGDNFTALLADQEADSGWIDSSAYSGAIISIVSDQDSADDGLIFENSKDGINVFHPHKHSVIANAPDGHHYPTTLECDYFRVRYINGPTDQTVFRVHIAMFVDMPEEAHVHPLEYAVDSDHSASIVRSVLLAKAPDGTYHNIGCTTGLNLKVALEELESEVAESIGLYPVGTGANGSIALTAADTAYPVPAAAPAGSYKVTVQNNSDVDIFIGYQNTAANGIKLEAGESASDNLGAGQQLFAYCASAGKSITYITKLIN